MVKYTDETLKQLHSTILEMLIEFDRICRKYNILPLLNMISMETAIFKIATVLWRW